MLCRTSLASETQENVSEAASPGPLLSGVLVTSLSAPVGMFPVMPPLGCWRALCTCLEPHLQNSGRRQLWVLEPRPGRAGLEQELGLSHSCFLPLTT